MQSEEKKEFTQDAVIEEVLEEAQEEIEEETPEAFPEEAEETDEESEESEEEEAEETDEESEESEEEEAEETDEESEEEEAEGAEEKPEAVDTVKSWEEALEEEAEKESEKETPKEPVLEAVWYSSNNKKYEEEAEVEEDAQAAQNTSRKTTIKAAGTAIKNRIKRNPQGNPKEKIPMDPAKKRRLLILAAVMILAALIFGGVILILNTKLTDIETIGNNYYTEEEVVSRIFDDENSIITVNAWYNELFGKKKDIPFIEKYKVKVTGVHSATLFVYEKAISGCVEYMGAYIYFDNDGVVVESAGTRREDIPLITGIKYKSIVMYEQMEVEKLSIFKEILNISQLLEKYGLVNVNVIFNTDGTVTLVVGDITCSLGYNKYIAEKIGEFHDMLSQLEGKAGTVYLDEYDPNLKNPSYPFVYAQ